MSAIDFQYRDVDGVFAGAERKGAVCFIDVKATKWDSPKLGPIISEQQWAKARLVHRMPGRQALFAIVWVWDVRSEAPKYEIWLDPADMVLSTHLTLSRSSTSGFQLMRRRE
ncbi:hypothetical protein MNEG_8672 [Monoraphidium neglectum]|uniref:Uncharacterized protein n=1 Tax=Monoraphidium neglectum TaxID=145388 RepID=A0A0D2M7F6_9CHLO|nr:hypothetical protein MNEG_8672 [Monoraphidium neglectum]KIY99289.1 hypothetical protein MNEG_8672 [Monoraphidium neglectum]|eukprot:XP_013898309.1 hypothetical protein MNEG_8672 [Monoraphidium neglectum]